MARVTAELFGGDARRTESNCGWNRHTVESGLHERASGIICVDDFATRGNKKRERQRPADPHSQADPPFKSTFSYPRLSAASVRRVLISEKGWHKENLPAPRTINTIFKPLVQSTDRRYQKGERLAVKARKILEACL